MSGSSMMKSASWAEKKRKLEKEFVCKLGIIYSFYTIVQDFSICFSINFYLQTNSIRANMYV